MHSGRTQLDRIARSITSSNALTGRVRRKIVLTSIRRGEKFSKPALTGWPSSQSYAIPPHVSLSFSRESLRLRCFYLCRSRLFPGFLLYQVLHPSRARATIDLSVMMGHPVAFSFPLPNGADREGWFYPGLRGAPTIVVCHGYHSQRADVLTLVTALQDQQFNVFLFDFTAHGTSPGVTTLGYRETAELQAAICGAGHARRRGSQAFRSLGSRYGRLRRARRCRRPTRALLPSSWTMPTPIRVTCCRSRSSVPDLTVLPYVSKFCDIGFRLVNYQFRDQPPVTRAAFANQGRSEAFLLVRRPPGAG